MIDLPGYDAWKTRSDLDDGGIGCEAQGEFDDLLDANIALQRERDALKQALACSLLENAQLRRKLADVRVSVDRIIVTLSGWVIGGEA